MKFINVPALNKVNGNHVNTYINIDCIESISEQNDGDVYIAFSNDMCRVPILTISDIMGLIKSAEDI